MNRCVQSGGSKWIAIDHMRTPAADEVRFRASSMTIGQFELVCIKNGYRRLFEKMISRLNSGNSKR